MNCRSHLSSLLFSCSHLLKLWNQCIFPFWGFQRKKIVSCVWRHFFRQNVFLFFHQGVWIDHPIILTFHFFQFNVRPRSTPTLHHFRVNRLFGSMYLRQERIHLTSFCHVYILYKFLFDRLQWWCFNIGNNFVFRWGNMVSGIRLTLLFLQSYISKINRFLWFMVYAIFGKIFNQFSVRLDTFETFFQRKLVFIFFFFLRDWLKGFLIEHWVLTLGQFSRLIGFKGRNIFLVIPLRLNNFFQSLFFETAFLLILTDKPVHLCIVPFHHIQVIVLVDSYHLVFCA